MDIWADTVASASLVVSGVFAGLVWWSTKQSSDISKRSFELSARLQAGEDEKRIIMQDHFRRQALERMQKVLEEIETMSQTTDGDVLLGGLKKGFEYPRLQLQQYLDYFDLDEKRQIDAFWDQFTRYVHETFMTPWMKDQYRFHTGTPDDETRAQYIENSKQILPKLHPIADALTRKWYPNESDTP